ncbi:DUF1850 domain-containing protein [Sneathiella sp.]|uniref:DUF1850 domain-containing protein n=1 Tax=Sneathiella sp. TaxID=1964365 RepID=UPI0035623810
MKPESLHMFLKKLFLLSGFIFALQNPVPAFAGIENHQLCVLSFPEKNILWEQNLTQTGTAFSLFFIHSVSKTEVEDKYHFSGERIIQNAEIFEAHGAGLPSLKNEVNETSWSHVDGKFVLALDRPIDTLIIRVNPEYRNRLTFKNTTIDLTQWGRRALLIELCH